MEHASFAAGNVALVTGAALGIGRAAALRFARMGLRVCMVDLPSADFDESFEEVSSAASDEVAAVPTDVSDLAAMEALKDSVRRHFGRVDILMNNAASRAGRGFDADLADWRRLVEVNLWGVIHGVKCFLPEMGADGNPGVIVNVGSKQGITNPPGHPVYNLSKAAVKSYTESLAHELRTNGPSSVTAHLLVPGWTTTGKSEHRKGAWMPEQVVDYMLKGIEAGSFYIICPDDEVSEQEDRRRILWGAGDITENRPALSRWHPDFKAAFETFVP
ncbi:SDR family NAD(P)-dependent oxidoreductase [Nisaea acidiphila]|uniref:SDR family NAD(P)-dependent oxidoreductase n=1 Tax=Nisaea acidiphila TaxID=1862145 RepID=A0A9J7AU71_9PROT|nr:SDR family NAD(P)-dependent oxidoreductase [Nisaea acidiphila]UUX51275.1 SDR family NAD(P)-dependent oxidoreductase [Nisaea acidiphila]